MVYEINKTRATKLEGLQVGVWYIISLGFEYDNFFLFFHYRYTNLCIWFSLLDGFSNQSSIATNVILAKERKRIEERENGIQGRIEGGGLRSKVEEGKEKEGKEKLSTSRGTK